ncbi:hypothetical protein EE612_052387, partial [Oryza sativa]
RRHEHLHLQRRRLHHRLHEHLHLQRRHLHHRLQKQRHRRHGARAAALQVADAVAGLALVSSAWRQRQAYTNG